MDNSGYLRKYTDTLTSNNGFYPPSSISPPSTPAPSHHGSFRQNSSMMYEPVSYGSKQASSESKSSASTAEPVNPQAKNSIASKSGGSRTSDFLKRCDNGTSSTRSSASGAPNRRARYGGSELRDLDDDDDSLERCFVNRRKYGHDHSSASNSSSNPRSSEGSSSMTAYEERKKTGRRGESNGTMTSPLGHVDPTSWLNGAQSSKFSDLLAASPPAHREVHRKILELAEYWMALPATKQRIDSVLQETIKQAEAEAIAGPAVVKQAWSDPITSNDKTVKDGRKSGDDSATTPTAEALKPASAGSITALPSPPATAAGTSDSAFPSIVGAKKTVNMEKQAGSVGSPAPAVAAVGSPRKSDAAAAPSPAPMSDATPTKTPALESPKSKSKSTIPSRATGLLSPTRSPKKTPLKESSAPPELPYKATSPSTAPNGAHGTPRLEAPTSLCTVTHPGPVASSSPVASVEPSPSNAPAPRNATYDEIPRFYFPLGRPTTKERVISGPLSKNNENPHLKIAEGTTLPIAMYDGGEKGATSLNHSQDEHSALGGRLAPMSTLRCADERTVHQFIHKEFAHVPSPVKLQKARMISSRQRGANGSSAVSKQESIYRQHLVQCMERICLHCFGVPRYLAHIIIKLIQDEMSEDHSASHRTKGSSTSSTGSSSTNNIITAQHVKDFYDVYLKNKDSLRRTFDVLILSSKLVTTTTQPAHHLADPTTLRPHLLPEDFHTYVEVLLQHHPGLIFLKEAPDFQSKYLDTVVHRIFYEVDKLDRGMISFTEFSMSRLMDAFRQLDASDDINAVLRFFSYEHFYVLYCLFWELDDDRDMMLSPQDFSRYITDDMMNPLIVQRVFSGVGRRLRCSTKNRICYEDFVWFCLSEEDKSTPPAIRYWFRILDLDGDGVLSIYELRMFFDATKAKVSQYVVDGGAAFEDVLCQVFDMMRCPTYTGISLAKLLGEPEGAHVALNMLTNVLKFYQFEQRDPFVAHQDRLMGGIEQTPWDRFARVQYDRMAQEVDE